MVGGGAASALCGLPFHVQVCSQGHGVACCCSRAWWVALCFKLLRSREVWEVVSAAMRFKRIRQQSATGAGHHEGNQKLISLLNWAFTLQAIVGVLQWLPWHASSSRCSRARACQTGAWLQ